MTDRPIKVGDHVAPSAEYNAFNKRNGLPRFKAQEVLAVLKPGEVGADYGFPGPNYGYLNYSESRLLLNGGVRSRNGDFIFWPFKHEDTPNDR